MRIALIDLGTNSVRFDVHQFGPGTRVRLLHREKVMVRLGQGVFTAGQLDPNAVHRTIHSFRVFKRICEDLNVRKIVAIATSALREASDGAQFVNAVREATGIGIRIISGPEEARLIAVGILANEKVPKGTFGLIDIGGGSTEISICKKKKVTLSQSFPLGTARLQQLFLKGTPPHPNDIDQLRQHIRQTFHSQMKKKRWPKTKDWLGSSGTVRAVARILRKKKQRHFELEELHELVRAMSKMTTTQLLGIPGMEPKRVDMILPGSILLEEAAKIFGCKKITATEFSLRHGLLREQQEIAKKTFRSGVALHFADIEEKAKKMGLDPDSLKQERQFAEKIFDRLRAIHGLGKEWKPYLGAAMMLRNAGQAVSMIGHQEHSHYIVKNAHFPFAEDWEAELIAKLCLNHERAKIEAKGIPFKGNLKLRRTFVKLLGILSLADALSPESGPPVKLKKVSIQKKSIEIAFYSNKDSGDMESLRVQQRHAIYYQAFRRSVAAFPT
jgi:exopolyphosphatase/guanosine-5'-triphosphate,3'-diphosphate pyrophosphatase